MLLAVVLGLMLGIVGRVLLQQWLSGVLAERPRSTLLSASTLSPSEFPRLARPLRTARPVRHLRPRPTAPRAGVLVRHAA